MNLQYGHRKLSYHRLRFTVESLMGNIFLVIKFFEIICCNSDLYVDPQLQYLAESYAHINS